jgi:hypothetical protein
MQTPPSEGFSILHGPRSDVLGPFKVLPEGTTATNATVASSLTFHSDFEKKRQISITVPLANTIFRTGQRSMLSVSTWQVLDGSLTQTRETGDLMNAVIKSFVVNRHPNKLPTIFIPAVPLTPVRTIVNGLGNIVRTIDFGQNGAGPASQELESAVTDYLKLFDGLTVDVWALVIPPEVIAKFSGSLLVDESIVRAKWLAPNSNQNHVGLWISRGATFCRVCKCLQIFLKVNF